MIIYLASPYSHDSAEVRTARFGAVCHVAGRLMAQGHTVFAPIAHSHVIAERYALPTEWPFWREHDFQFIEACGELWVVTLDGWADSVGVGAEIDHALRLEKPVRLLDPITLKAKPLKRWWPARLGALFNREPDYQ